MKYYPQQQTVDYFQASPVGAIGQLVSTTPIVAAARLMKPNGVGQTGEGFTRDWGTGMMILGVVVLGVTGALSYQAGKAMAPSKAEGKTWGWVGVPVGMLTGPWGLGVMGIISNSRKG